jgi:hypothetical protein
MNKKYFGILALCSCAIAYAASTASIYPTGAGTYSQWTPSTGTTHYTLVDETSCNGTTDYVSTTVNGNRDSYAVSLASVPDGSTITSVSVTPCASRNSNKTSVMNVFYRLNGVNSADQGAYSLTGTTPVQLASTNFSGLSVVKGASTTLEIGAVLTSGTGGARLSQLATSITYTPTLPSDPTNLLVTSTGTRLLLTWSDNANNESSYKIEKGTDGVNFSFTGSVLANVTSFIDATTTSGVTYYYRVYAVNETGNSGYSNVASGSRP